MTEAHAADPARPRPPARSTGLVLSVLAPMLVWLVQFVALQALLGLGCGRLDTQVLRWAAVASGAFAAATLALLSWCNPRARPGAGVALAGVGWSMLAALWLAPCAPLA